jgi:hypothetical protein
LQERAPTDKILRSLEVRRELGVSTIFEFAGEFVSLRALESSISMKSGNREFGPQLGVSARFAGTLLSGDTTDARRKRVVQSNFSDGEPEPAHCAEVISAAKQREYER